MSFYSDGLAVEVHRGTVPKCVGGDTRKESDATAVLSTQLMSDMDDMKSRYEPRMAANSRELDMIFALIGVHSRFQSFRFEWKLRRFRSGKITTSFRASKVRRAPEWPVLACRPVH